MSKKLKLFGLLALTVALGAGVAWAAFSGTTTLNGTRPADLVVDKITAVGENYGANTFNEIAGSGKLTGAVLANVATGNGGGAAGPLVLALNASETNTVELAPAAGKNIAEGTGALGNYGAIAAGNNLQVIVNGPVDLPDNAENTNNGTVVIRGANADSPTIGAAGWRNHYWGGTFAYGGTLGVSENNALGQGWVALMARSAASSRRGATFSVNGTTRVRLGIEDPASQTTGQPVYLVADQTEALTPAARHVQQAFINVDSIGGKAQELWLNHGLREVKNYTTASNLAGGNGAAWPDVLLTWTAAQMAPMTRAQAPAAAPAAHLTQLVKTGAGNLYITSDGTGLPAFDAVNGKYAAYRGAMHEGGTIVRGGTLQIDGRNATTWRDRYTGFLGSVWRLGNGAGEINNAGTTSDAGYVSNSAGSALAIHNPLYLENNGKVIVDRAQVFSFFRGAKDTEFTANQFSLAGVNERPVIFVTLNNEHSDFDGKLSGSFDLVVDSKVSAFGALAGRAVQPGQAQLRLGKAENDITGLTRVDNGVLSVAGANSIAPKGPGTLTVGTGDIATTPDKAVFLAVANSTFMNPTILRGTRVNAKPANATNITRDGALAAASGTKVAFSDVTIDGSMEINPRAVNQTIAALVGDDSIRWTDAQPYPTWTGMVAFGEGASADYSIGGSVHNITQVAISRGTWHLAKLPKDNGTGFANVMIRQDATLSLGDGARDFSKCLDVQVDNDSRIRLVVKPEDVAKSREAAMAKEPIFKAREIDYTWLGTGGNTKDFRLNLWVDISALGNKLSKGDWLKLVQSDNAIQWNHLHYLREYSGTRNEDKVKVVVTFCDKDGKRITDINMGDESVSSLMPLDEGSHTILVPVLKDFTGPASEDTKPTVDTATAVITAPAEVKPGAAVTFELGKWSYKTSSDVEVTDVKWTLNGEDKTADAKDNKLTVKDVKEGTLSLVVTGKLKADPTVEAKAEKSVTVKKDGGPTPGKSSGGGCDAGFGALALVAGAAFLLRKKN